MSFGLVRLHSEDIWIQAPSGAQRKENSMRDHDELRNLFLIKTTLGCEPQAGPRSDQTRPDQTRHTRTDQDRSEKTREDFDLADLILELAF